MVSSRQILLVQVALMLTAAPFVAASDAGHEEGMAITGDPAGDPVGPVDEVGHALATATGQDSDPGSDHVPAPVRQLVFEEEESAPSPVPPPSETPRFSERMQAAFGGALLWAGIASLGATGLGLTGFAMVTRYISPKEALKNPQRAMLYGFIKATPGAHLKQLSEEFAMKTSSILWHIRKLEAADLVRSERANGFRVFYQVAGGVEVKRLSRGITALQNDNARAVHGLIDRRPGQSVKQISERLGIHAGTVRWHVRKLREFGLLEELVREDGSQFFSTPLGKKALEAMEGSATESPRRASQSAPTPE